MEFSPLFTQLTQALRVLPGVGPKTAQRMALHLLQRERAGGQQLANMLSAALTHIGYCQRCRNLSETPLCAICQSPRLQEQLLCIVESPADLMAIEQTRDYQGHYFVLHGHLSPLDGIGPEALGFAQLESEIDNHCYQEVILAMNPTVEGEASAHYIVELLRHRRLRFSRLAYGLPLGSELEYIDGATLARAFTGRLPFNDLAIHSESC